MGNKTHKSIMMLGAFVASVLVNILIPFLPAATASAATNQPILTPNTPALTGVVGHNDPAKTARFENWRGTKLQVINDFMGSQTWAGITGFDDQHDDTKWANFPNAHMVWSVPMLPSNDGDVSLQIGATGAYNDYFKSLATQMVAAGQGSSTIRLGWENTWAVFKWNGVTDPTDYAAYWRQIVTTMRSVPGADFTFDFNTGSYDIDPTPLYPGDDYVDFIGTDIYDSSWAVSYPATDHEKVWQQKLYDKPYGINWVYNFAKAHNKRFSIPEWGLVYRCDDAYDGGDDPYFVQQMYNWIHTHDVAYEAYFNSRDSSCRYYEIQESGAFPQSAQVYLNLWGTSQPYTLVTTGGKALDGATVAANDPIYIPANPAIRYVLFSVDGTFVDDDWSGDFNLTVAGIAPGVHKVSAVVVGNDGSRTTITATYTQGYTLLTGGMPLSGQTLSSSDPVYIPSDPAIHYVLFSVDGTFIDDDWAGSGDFNLTTSKIGSGTHKVSAVVVGNDGSRTTVTGAYTIQ